jgi:hypothetical protein
MLMNILQNPIGGFAANLGIGSLTNPFFFAAPVGQEYDLAVISLASPKRRPAR